nr:hypothetical protein [Escherichia coli]
MFGRHDKTRQRRIRRLIHGIMKRTQRQDHRLVIDAGASEFPGGKHADRPFLTTDLINTGITRHHGTKRLTFTHFFQNHRRQRQSSRTRLAALAGVFNHHPTESAVTIDASFNRHPKISLWK